jgi:uncharacterized protein YacL
MFFNFICLNGDSKILRKHFAEQGLIKDMVNNGEKKRISMVNIWDKDDIYYSIAGIVLVICSYFFSNYFWKWWKEIKDGKPTINQSTALRGAVGGVFFFIVGIMLLYFSFFLPFLNWLRH